mmetsp:Transcript_43193/g.78570  ORF Transcript_43193/g.78570 Transcript_43193/m.78570 type:complete len:344 (+) Transcript_43193:62-1093(+)
MSSTEKAADSVVHRIEAAGLEQDDFFRRFVAANTPVVVQGALSESTPCLTWTPQQLADLAPPDASVKVAPLMGDGRDKWIESTSLWSVDFDSEEPLPGVLHKDRVLAVAASRIEVSAQDFADSLQGRGTLPSLYADGASNLAHSFGFLEQELPKPPSFGEELQYKRTDLWLGGRTLSTLHFDNYENLFAQLVGEKEFTLCPPGDTEQLLDGRLRKAFATWQPATGTFERAAGGLSEQTVLNYAAYDIDNPGAEYKARASKLRRQVVRVRAGEVLYLPFGWWHQVRAIPSDTGLCASAAFFYEPFFVRLQPKSLPHAGRLVLNPKYRATCVRLGLYDSDSDEEA